MRLTGDLEKQGLRARVVSARRLADLGRALEDQRSQGLLEGRGAGDLPSDLVEKLEQADLLAALDTFPRNLGGLLRQQRS